MRYSLYNANGERVLDFIVPDRTRTDVRDGVMEFKSGSSIVFSVGVGPGFSVGRSDVVVEIPVALTTAQPVASPVSAPATKIPPPPVRS